MNKSKGYYFGQYNISTEKYFGPDFSKRCFVFPGQGAAFPGMFKDKYSDFKIIREKFALADSLAKKFNFPKISDYILNPDGLKKEALPAVANLALFTLESAFFDIFISSKIIPKIITGHSFGEYGALTASGIISFEKMFDIIYHRDYFCPPANSLGFMVAVNADVKKTKAALKKGKYYISNINSPRQTVISVSKNTIDEIARMLEDKKIRYKILYNVPQPYHSPYLNEVKKKIEEYFRNKISSKKFGGLSFSSILNNLEKPKIPFFSSALNKLIDKDNFKKEDIKKILVNQITTPVNFISQIKMIYSLGCFNFLELGCKKLSLVFIEDILADGNKEIKTVFASDFLQKKDRKIFKFVSLKNDKLFSLINETIGKITGYKVEKMSLGYKFQEDLGIDSIKKADILLTLFNKLGIRPDENFNTSKFKDLKEVFSYFKKMAKRGENKKENFTKSILPAKETNFKRYIFAPIEKPLKNYFWEDKRKNNFLFLDIADILKNKDILLKKLESFFGKKEIKKEQPNIIIRASNIDLDFYEIILIFEFFRDFLNTIGEKDFNLILLSFGRPLDQKADPYIYCLASFFKSFKKEVPGIFFKHIHFDNIRDKKTIFDIAAKEIYESSEIDILYRNGKRFIFTPKNIGANKDPDLNEKSIILAIGGAKGITFSLIKNISREYKPTIYLIGKTSGENESVRANMTELKKVNPKIYYESLDACDVNSTEKLFSKIMKEHKKIDLIINGAGVVKVGFLKNKTNEDINYEFTNKVLPAFNILNLSLKYKPKIIVNFSSIISKYGNAGQSIYTSANALVSKLTEKYNSILKEFGSSAITVHWPPWDGVGMTSNEGIFQKLKEYGVSLLKPQKADELFLSDLSSLDGEPVYYLDDFDNLFYGFLLNNFKQYEPLLGKSLNQFAVSIPKPVFEKKFNLLEDTYLKDHKIKNLFYVPAAVEISMFLCLGNIYFKNFPVLKNITLLNPIIVKNEPVRCFLKSENKNRLHVFSIKSTVPHFYCETEINGEKKIFYRDLIKISKGIAKNFIYADFYSDNSFYRGPIFQCIDKVLTDEKGNSFFIIDNSKLLPVLGIGVYDKLIQWIDALFTSLGAVALKCNSKIIPIKISKLSFFPKSEISNYVYAIPSITKFTADGLEGNARLVNKKGEVIFELIGISLKKYENE